MPLMERVEGGVELLVGLLGGQPLGEGAGEAGDHAGVAGEAVVGLLAAVATGEGDDAEHLRVGDELGVEPVLLRQGQLEHDLLVGGQGVEAGEQSGARAAPPPPPSAGS